MRIIKLIDLPFLRDELAAKTQIGNRHFTKAQLSFLQQAALVLYCRN